MLTKDDKLVTDPPAVHAIWTEHFSNLARPQSSEQNRYHDLVTNDLLVLDEIVALSNDAHNPVTPNEVIEACSKLNLRKALDLRNISSEHIKHSTPQIASFITSLYSAILQSGHLPPQLLEAYTIPIHKKGKYHTFFTQNSFQMGFTIK